jgi:hypothetical protein
MRVPIWQGLHPVISRDAKWLGFPLDDGQGTNLWMASTTDGKLKRITDFGHKRTFIKRRVRGLRTEMGIRRRRRRRCGYRADGWSFEVTRATFDGALEPWVYNLMGSKFLSNTILKNK